MSYQVQTITFEGKEYYSLTHLAAILNLACSTIYKIIKDYEGKKGYQFPKIIFHKKTQLAFTKNQFEKIVECLKDDDNIQINKKREKSFFKAFDLCQESTPKKDLLDQMRNLLEKYHHLSSTSPV